MRIELNIIASKRVIELFKYLLKRKGRVWNPLRGF